MKKNIFFMILVFLGCTLPAMAVQAETSSAETSLTHKMMMLAIQVGIILFAAKLGGMLASVCKLPSVLGELGAGIAIGPYALGEIIGIFPNYGGAFPVTPELYGFCTIASIILLFLAGLETDLKMFLKYSIAGSLVGIGGVTVSFLAGDLLAVYALPYFLPDVYSPEVYGHALGIFDAPCMFLGIMGTATSVGITARILSERKSIDSEEGVTIMAGAVIDDVLGIIILAIGLGLLGTSGADKANSSEKAAVDWVKIGIIAAKALGIWMGATVLGIVTARKISTVLKYFKNPFAIATMALGLALILSGIFQHMGLAMIIGAYVMGLALSRTDIRYLVQENLHAVYTFMVPIFFCVMGMMVDCSKLTSSSILIFGGIYTLFSILAKLLGCAVPAYICGFNTLGALRIGSGMIPRGEVALIIAGIGLSAGFLTPEIFGVGILMTLMTTLVSPPMLVALFGIKKSGLRHKKDDKNTSRPFFFSLPSSQSAALMCDKLIAAFRTEGFFTYMLNQTDNIWQVSKDDSEIVISQRNKELHFECTPMEESFVATAILEVVSELNQLAHDLSRPLKSGQIAQILQEQDASGTTISHTAEMGRYLRHFVMIPKMRASSTEDLIKQMTTALADRGYIHDLSLAQQSILSRENAMSTGLDHGIAVPHGRTDAVDGLVGCIALINDENGVPGYMTADKSPVRIVILTIASEKGTTPHLQMMAYMSRKLRQSGGYDALVACKTPAEMLKFFL